MAYGLVPIPGITLTAEMLEAAFASCGAALTGVTLPGLGIAAVIGGIGGYALWEHDDPEAAQEFRTWLTNSLNATGVSNNVAHGLSADMGTLPTSVKTSIVSYSADTVRTLGGIPTAPEGAIWLDHIPTDWDLSSGTYYATNPSTNRQESVSFSRLMGWVRYGYITVNADNVPTVVDFPGNGCTASTDSQGRFVVTSNTETFRFISYYPNANTGAAYIQAGVSRTVSDVCVPFGWASVDPARVTLLDTPSAVSGLMDSLIAGVDGITAGDVVDAADVAEVYIPGVTVDTATGVPTTVPYDVQDVTYDEYVTGSGGGTVDPSIPEGVLEGLGSILDMLTTIRNIVTTIPPIGQDLPREIAEAIGGGVIDIPGAIAELQGAIIDIPGQVADIAETIIDIPGAIADLQGAIIDIPGQIGDIVGPIVGGLPIGQILTGVEGLGTLGLSILDGVIALPGNIADALDLDWALENLDDLKSRFPELQPALVLPQATFDELYAVLNQYQARTPLGKIFMGYRGAISVMSGGTTDGGTYGGQGSGSQSSGSGELTSSAGSAAPRYEFVLPAPINYTFVVDFSMFDGAFVMICHAFFYLLGLFWYFKFLKTIRGWYDWVINSSHVMAAAEDTSRDEG